MAISIKIAVLITTFLRNSLLYKTIQSISDSYTFNCKILIADQGYPDSEKDITIDYFKSQINLEYYYLPFDCGMSVARNFLVNKAHEMNIPYCLVMPDSIQFLESYNFKPLFPSLNENIIVNFLLKKIDAIPLKDIFLAKTDNLRDLWDTEMKIYEYNLAEKELLKRGCRIGWDKGFNFKKIISRSTDEYQSYCKRLRDYKRLSEQKLKCI